MRVGKVVKVIPGKKIGFIRSGGLREDVFFHFSKVEKVGTADLTEDEEVEFEIDELARIEDQRLQATLVRRSVRQLEMRLKASDAPELHAKHHPKARKRRPTWRSRESDEPTGVDEEAGNETSE
ncbi:MAG: cold shock domain-containing protein [Planctomycetota bacterium]